jgi:hypothetical protein
MLGFVRPLISLLLLLAALLTAQNPPAPPKAQVFSGFVTEFTTASLTVSRKNASGKEMVHRSFSMDAKTKVEGTIKLNARVTVQFMPMDDGNHAQRVIVRGN